ncbi:MAG: pyrroline-5-carboxylate reductase [Candidatus Omnitrophica bacterium]|nr:pyrroline-5-carboxylate reductase [Candidatus Omnitrophota bacterium]MDD5237676.1 pyrroline-5-carboxylate reductase [Candidatus Omnitrophota bacterium]
MKEKIGIIGFGNMGSAIAERLKDEYDVFVVDKDTSRLRTIPNKSIVGCIPELVELVDIILIAVKPQDIDEVLKEIKLSAKGKMFISIAAGIGTTYIEGKLGNIRVVRAMPNLGAITGKSITCICKGKFTTQDDIASTKNIFSLIGKVQEVNEDKLDAVTAVSGSGPGYYFDAVVNHYDEYKQDKDRFSEKFIDSLAKAAKEVGLDEQLSLLLAKETIIASELVLAYTKLSPEELRNQVTSKGGTTEAALQILHNGGTLTDAVKVAVMRAKELSRG